jgi:hypothetical protein
MGARFRRRATAVPTRELLYPRARQKYLLQRQVIRFSTCDVDENTLLITSHALSDLTQFKSISDAFN